MTTKQVTYLEQIPLHIPVKILDRRRVWGRDDCLVSPIGGSGEQWVSAERIITRQVDNEGNPC